ncbi:hypothetical protein T09_7337 [Trichinella sp. T9]|nr:hypothetical protein T09_7337 [Trichinella sp. T9]
MSISCSVLAFTRSAVFSFSDVLSRRMLRRCDCDERLSCEQFRDAILYSRFKTSKAEMDLSASVRIAIVPFEEVDGAALLFCHPSNISSTPIFE